MPFTHSILFFLKRNSTPLVRLVTILFLRACTRAMSIAGWTPAAPKLMPHSAASCAIFSACACSSSAFVGMHPQMRQVPPSEACRSTTRSEGRAAPRGWRPRSRPCPRRSRRRRTGQPIGALPDQVFPAGSSGSAPAWPSIFATRARRPGEVIAQLPVGLAETRQLAMEDGCANERRSRGDRAHYGKNEERHKSRTL